MTGVVVWGIVKGESGERKKRRRCEIRNLSSSEETLSHRNPQADPENVS